MASTLTHQIAALQNEIRRQRDIMTQHKDLADQQQSVLNIQFRRIADIQAELDLVKATVRLAAPGIAATLIGRGVPEPLRPFAYPAGTATHGRRGRRKTRES